MKKITLLVSALALTGSMFGQSQRLVLAEEFTQASCPPCAAANPGYNALLQTNVARVASIKYQTSWPGVDPMNLQNPTDVQTRVTYYAVSGVPDGQLDGVDFYPGSITQAQIDAEKAIMSPFTIAVSHSFSSDFSTVTIHEVITCTQAVTGPLINHIALVEKEINFTTAPGTNGELDFYEVMKKMYPSAAGTALATTWTVGQTQTINMTVPIPSYVYDLNNVNIVAFIQNNTTKAVQQAGRDNPLTLPVSTNDAGITATSNLNAIQCSGTINPSVTVKNFAATTLTSCTLNYSLDGGGAMTAPWTGSLATNATAVVALPSLWVPMGSHTLTTWTSNPNGHADYHMINNSNSRKFNIIGGSTTAPLVEGFVGSTFPPANWIIDDADANYPWARTTSAGGFGTSMNSARVPFFADPAGNIEDMYLSTVSFSWIASGTLTFDVAYAQYTTENDKLEVQISTNCGATWTSLYSKQGATLSTAPAVTTSFVPTATQWRTETVTLPATNSYGLIRFRATSAYGNNLYVDNINLATVLGVNDNSSSVNSLDVYPNPVNDNATVNFNLANATNVDVTVYSILGDAVYANKFGQMSSGDHSINIDASKLDAGIYFVTLNVADGKITKKISINK